MGAELADRLPRWFADCLMPQEEALQRVVRSGMCVASGFATSEPHSFYEGVWDHIRKHDLTDLSFRQALFMAPHPLCIGDALSARGWLEGQQNGKGPWASLARKLNKTSRKLDGLGRLVAHYRELQRRRIRFVTPFIGASLNPVIPDNLLTRQLYPEWAGRNTTRGGITDMQSIHFPDAVHSMFHGADGVPYVDAFVAVMTPPDEQGELSHGLANGANGDAMQLLLSHGGVQLLLYLNPRYPFTRGHGDSPNTVHIDRFRSLAEAGKLVVVEDTGRLPAAPAGSFSNPSPSELAIARLTVDHIEQHTGMTRGRAIQVGIGRTGVQVMSLLKESSWSGRLYTEMLEPNTLGLVEAGKIAGSHYIERDGTRTPLDGKLVCTFTMCESGAAFYEKLDRNPAVVLAPASRVVISEGFFGGLGINNCLGIDFQGHVNAGGKDSNHHSGIGGLAMIVRGLSNGGVSYLCMKSTHRTPEGGRRSSIFPYLPEGTPISLVGADLMGGRNGGVLYLVTEQGVARLSGRSQAEYIKELVSVAHPEFRDELKHKAYKEFRVRW